MRADQELERLSKDTPAWYVGTRARVEARAALEQAEEWGESREHCYLNYLLLAQGQATLGTPTLG